MWNVEKVKAGIIGLAVADALGVPVECCWREDLTKDPVTDMRAYGTHDQPAGTWSDDTSMTLCLMDSIIECGDINYKDIADHFLRWKNEAYLTATDVRFDIGRTVLRAMHNYERTHKPLKCGVYGDNDAGNGSLMRILPLVYWLDSQYSESFINTAEARDIISKVSGITHAHIRCIIACGIYLAIAQELLHGVPLEDAVCAGLEKGQTAYRSINACWAEEVNEHYAYTADELKLLTDDKIGSSGYVVDTMKASLWCLLTTDSYADCVLKAVNLGRDSDTTAAVEGGLAGLAYGFMAIPNDWVSALQKYKLIDDLCQRFFAELDR